MIKKVIYLLCSFSLATMIFGGSVLANTGEDNHNNGNNDVVDMDNNINDDVRNVATGNNDDDDTDWGWVGLIGLAGLLGLRRRDTRD
ncbi:WGxxGxxG family protein [Halobacillus sp. H74]|uniref:WGxxGxxG family protein n=1 Tax=Halobacillus sp. H74 TaxID=3457436 RepID=UPI003FCDE151